VFRATPSPSPKPDSNLLLFAFCSPWGRILLMDKKLHVFVCQLFAHHSYSDFDQKLRDLRAVPLMHSIWATRTVLTAKELNEVLRKTVDDTDKILVVEVSAGWASRRAENNLGDLFPPRGGPALALWKQRWGE